MLSPIGDRAFPVVAADVGVWNEIQRHVSVHRPNEFSAVVKDSPLQLFLSRLSAVPMSLLDRFYRFFYLHTD